MDSGDNPANQMAEDLEELRRHIAELRHLMLEPPPAAPARPEVSEAARRGLERIRVEIEAQNGFFPPFLGPVADLPEILAPLWQQMRSAYLRNPIPELTREKLFARASRACPVSYAILSHCCMLRQQGMAAAEILRWLERPVPDTEEGLATAFALFGSLTRPLPAWPEPGSAIEECLQACALVVFLHPDRSSRARAELLGLLGPANYAWLSYFLLYMKGHHSWLEAFPEPPREEDAVLQTNLQALLAEEPRLASFFENYRSEPPPAKTAPAARISPPPASAESLLPAILDHGPFGVAVLDSEYRILKCNQVLCRLLGRLEPELEALSFPAIIHPQDVGDSINRIDQVLSGSRSCARMEKRFLKRSKDIVWVELTVSAVRRPDGSPLYSLVFMEDISERKEEQEVRHSEKLILERLLHDSQDGIFFFDRELICTAWNPAMERIFGIEERNAIGCVLFDVLPFLAESDDDRYLLEALRGEAVAVRDRRFQFPATGREGYYDAYYTPISGAGGRITGGIAFVRDISERKKAEETWRATEERYRELFENANDIVYTHDLDGRITSINKAAELITGYTRAEALRLNARQLVVPEHLRAACRMIERQVGGESPPPFEIDIICKDGRRVALEISTHIISRDGKPAGVQGIARDITERKKTEEALQQAKQNLEAWVQELEQRTREMTLLNEMGDMLRACMTTEEAYSVIVRVAQQIFPVQVGALHVISAARNQVEAAAVWGDASQVERVFTPDECWALRRGRVHWVEDTDNGLLCKHLPQPPPRGYLCVPMMAQSEALGVLYLTQPANSRLTEAKQRLAVAMAEHIAMALSNLKLHETLRSQSIRDPLTGLFNRRFMEESLELELRRAARNRRPLGTILLEVDNLQAISRSFGSDAEDSVLVELGNLLQTIIRKEDIACRFDAEKFMIILPHGSLEIAAQRAGNLCELVKDLEIRHRGRSVGRIAISVGIAGFPEQGRMVEAIFRAADAALQRAKAEGGDRVVIAQ